MSEYLVKVEQRCDLKILTTIIVVKGSNPAP